MERTTFNADLAFEHIQYLSTSIGSRLTGTENCKKAAEYIEAFFRQLGLAVQTQGYPAESIDLIHHSVEILVPPLGFIPSTPYLFTQDTPASGLEGEIIVVEEGEETSLASQITGKIVLWSPRSRGTVPREICRYNPLAILIISSAPGTSPRHDFQYESFFAPFAPVTTFRISWEDGYRLVQAGANRARFTLNSRRYPSKGRNIVAELKGSEFPDEIITVCAHYDSPPDTPSATDNASGTATMLELARLYSQHGSKRTLRFIAFDGEEAGFTGSAFYINQLKRQADEQKSSPEYREGLDKIDFDKHLFCVNLDVLGMALGSNSCHVQGPPEVAALFKVMSKELGVPHQVFEGMYGSDNDSFALAGIPGVNFGRMGPSFFYIHTDQDTLDLIDVKQLKKIGDFVDTFLYRYAATAVNWPFERYVPEDQIKRLKESLRNWMGSYFETAYKTVVG